ncbi:hypothetical protein [Thomasclavelia sp.]
MKILELLHKYRYKTKLNQTELFDFVNSGSKEIIEEGFCYKVKYPWDLFAYEVILKGIRAKKTIDQCYNSFLADNYDLFDHISYKQRQNIFLNEIKEVSEKLVSFKDCNSGEIIYIPFLEPFLNKYYLNDYLLITLKHHLIYIKEFSKDIDIFAKLYDMQPYNSDFSTLKSVGKDSENEYLYHDEFKVVYQFNNNKIVNEICLIDKYTKEYPDLNIIKCVMSKIINQDSEGDILEYLYEHKFIGDKTYKKIKKKLK